MKKKEYKKQFIKALKILDRIKWNAMQLVNSKQPATDALEHKIRSDAGKGEKLIASNYHLLQK